MTKNYSSDRLVAARRLAAVSPDSPCAKAILIELDWPNVKQHAEAWEKDAARQPAMLMALGKRHLEDGKFAAAERCLKAAVAIAPSEATYSELAAVYDKQGDEDKWLATMEELLQRPDGAVEGLNSFHVRESIALHFMERKQWEKAEPYAEENAKTGGGEALLLAGGCQEGMQNWDAAEERVRNAATTFTQQKVAWYCFCRRTGHGDLDAARQMAREFVENFDPNNADWSAKSGYDAYANLFYILEQQFDKALQIDEERFAKDNNPYLGLRTALLADRLKDGKKRDAALQQIKEKGATHIRQATGKPRMELVALADLMAQDLARGGKGDIDLKAADKICLAAIDDAERENCFCFLASYLDLHGKKNEAIRYWKRCVNFTRPIFDLNRTLAGAELIARGIKPETVIEKPKKTK